MKKKTTMKPTPETYPMRINKYLAHKGVATRKGVDELIEHSKVLINGRVAKLGDKVLETDKVEVRGAHTKKKLVYLAYNKPKGIVSINPQYNEKEVLKNIKIDKDIFPVGRLDKETSGLMILTNDGRITDRLLNPVFEHEKEYEVEVDRKFTPGFVRNMEEGVDIGEKYITKKCTVKKKGEKVFLITLVEGKNHQIKRMTEKLGYTVRNLKRIHMQNITLGKIPSNSYREIIGEELDNFLNSIGLKSQK